MASPDCSCGYFDAVNGKLWTDSIIVYFNETQTLPTDIFYLADYANGAEKSWNAAYRQGGAPQNSEIDNTTYIDRGVVVTNSSMKLWVSPATADHLVVGGGIETKRRDIRYGSFRTWMRSPPPNFPKGTSLSMELRYDVYQGVQMNLQNTNDNQTAWVSNLMADDFPDRSFGVNYTVMANRNLPNSTPNPFNFYEQRIEWNQDNITFYAGSNATRFITSDQHNFFNTPSSFNIKHWSIGDEYAMEGPPLNGNVSADVGWVRAFFNTSSSTLNSTCQVSLACDVDDYTLRGNTTFPPSALQKWHAPALPWSPSWPAIAICGFALCFTIIVVLNQLFRKLILERGVKQPEDHGHASPVYQASVDSSTSDLKKSKFVEAGIREDDESSTTGTVFSGPSASASGAATPWHGGDWSNRGTLVSPTPTQTRPPSIRDTQLKDFDATWKARKGSNGSGKASSEGSKSPTPPDSIKGEKITSRDFLPPVPGEHDYNNGLHFHETITTGDILGDDLKRVEYNDSAGTHSIIAEVDDVKLAKEKGPERVRGDEKKAAGAAVVAAEVKPSATAASKAGTAAAAPPPKQRIDYLAGLVALCSLLVTGIHFALTFVPALVFPAGFAHYPGEVWGRKLIGPYLFNQIWVGLFFATSTRFLVMKYLKTGSLQNIAEKVVARVPRLFLPIGAIILLEYFLIDVGAITYLQYLPSVTWSTWPYTVEFQNFGIFVNEYLELIYLVPNAVPRIVFNYCIGVLWTIPVQLQGTWTALLGAIIIVECKTPYKRFGYYGINIIYNWYTLDWGAFFWFGLLLTDLDVIYNYRTWLYARPWVYYPCLVFFIICGVMGLTNDLISAWTPVNFAAIEFNIHPDLITGLPLSQTVRGVFPVYYAPTIKHLLFCLGFQAVVELSTTVQKMLSNRFFVWCFPHIFTIYLIHGFIFWSLGATVCVMFNWLGLPYWANSLLVAVICYATLAIVIQFITPVMEILGKDGAANAWRMANAKVPVVKWKPTLYPYPTKTIIGRPEATDRGFAGVPENGTDVENSPGEVAVINEQIAEENAVFIERAIEEEDLQRLEVIASMRGSKLESALARG